MTSWTWESDGSDTISLVSLERLRKGDAVEVIYHGDGLRHAAIVVDVYAG